MKFQNNYFKTEFFNLNKKSNWIIGIFIVAVSFLFWFLSSHSFKMLPTNDDNVSMIGFEVPMLAKTNFVLLFGFNVAILSTLGLTIKNKIKNNQFGILLANNVTKFSLVYINFLYRVIIVIFLDLFYLFVIPSILFASAVNVVGSGVYTYFHSWDLNMHCLWTILLSFVMAFSILSVSFFINNKKGLLWFTIVFQIISIIFILYLFLSFDSKIGQFLYNNYLTENSTLNKPHFWIFTGIFGGSFLIAMAMFFGLSTVYCKKIDWS